MKRLEKVQGDILKRILGLPKSTPYWAILEETGIWPMERRIQYQRLMLFQNLIDSKDERLGKQLIPEQRNNDKKNWYVYTKEVGKKLGLEIKKAGEVTKKEWKKQINVKIGENLEREAKEKG